MLTGENIASATHICSKLIDVIESAVHNGATKSLVPQVTHYEIVGGSLREFMKFQINPANPKPIVLQTFDKMTADEASSPAYKCAFCHLPASKSLCQDSPHKPTPCYRPLYSGPRQLLALKVTCRFVGTKYPKRIGNAVSAM
jgi:hypothetical protein